MARCIDVVTITALCAQNYSTFTVFVHVVEIVIIEFCPVLMQKTQTNNVTDISGACNTRLTLARQYAYTLGAMG